MSGLRVAVYRLPGPATALRTTHAPLWPAVPLTARPNNTLGKQKGPTATTTTNTQSPLLSNPSHQITTTVAVYRLPGPMSKQR